MTNAAAALAENPNFSALTAEQSRRLLARAKQRPFAEGATLMRQGEEGTSMIVLAAGTVVIQRGDKTLATLTAGQTIGEMAMVDPGPRSATATATSAGSCYELDRGDLWGMLAEGDDAAIHVLQGITATVCGRLGGVNSLVQDEVLAPKGNVFSRLWAKVGNMGKK
jgi:CRP-like cAMP-binding protein